MPEKHIFATVLTHTAPSSNYRGESEENRTIIQKISRHGQHYPVISPESMRNALREILTSYDLPMNRSRLHNEDQLAVEFKEYPDAERYADDFLFGFLVADKKAIKENKNKPAKRDSVVRMNLAVSLVPYRFDATFHQSPLNAGDSPWKNSSTSALLHREVSYNAYQYPLALSVTETKRTKQGPAWTKALLRAIGELNGVAGGHARSYFEMAPKSIVVRHTPSLVAGFDTYAFDEDGKLDKLLSRLNEDDLPAEEFWIGGEIVRQMDDTQRAELAEQGVKLFVNPQRLLSELGEAMYE